MTSSAMSCCLCLSVLALLVNGISTTFLGKPGGGTLDLFDLGEPDQRNASEPQEPESPVEATRPGPVCTRLLGRRCLSQARCLRGNCVCSAHRPVGDGQLECTRPGNMVCSVDCDPKVQTWKEARAPVNLPCWYRVTKALIPIHPAPHHAIFKWCQVQVRALNTLTSKGLFFVGTVIVDLWVSGVDSKKFFLHADSYRRFEVNVNRARQSIRTARNPWRVWEKKATFWDSEDVRYALGLKLEVFTSWEPADRFAVLWVPQCDVRIKYRPFGKTQPQKFKPGVVVTLRHDDNIIFHTPYFSAGVCLTPLNTSSALKEDATRWKLKNAAQVALFYALLQKGVNASEAKNRDFHEQCVNSRKHLQHKDCQDGRYLAIRLCAPLLNLRHRFVHCLGRQLVMEAFDECVTWACFGKLPACYWLKETLHLQGCHPTRLMRLIDCREDRRKHYRDLVFQPAHRIEEFGY